MTRRLRLPSLWWRTVTVLVVTAVILNDPSLDRLFSARADCDVPANSSTETTRITDFACDFDGRLVQVSAPEGAINYDYDLATGRHIRTCTRNSEVGYGYDELGRLKTVSVLKRNGIALSTPEVTTNTYTAVGNRETVMWPNGVVSTYKYDTLNRLTNLTHKVATTNLATYTYQVHATGRRTNAVEVLRQENGAYLTNTVRWAYDGMYRLTDEVSSSSASGGQYSSQYQYDKVGNRLKKLRVVGSQTETNNYVYNDNDQLLREEITALNGTLSTNNYAYDANGSLTGKTNANGTALYSYNLANKMSGVTVAGVTTSYLYNDQGIRVRSTTGSSTTHYLVDANNHTGYAQVLEELSNVGATPTRSYVIGDDVVAQATSDVSYLLYDGHGSTRQLMNTAAGVTSRYNYDGYGIMLDSSSSTPETDLRYCGEQFDTALQMYNLRARYYNPLTGAFSQRDTFLGDNHDPQSIHKYLYVDADPITRIDPSGSFSIVETLVSATINLINFTIKAWPAIRLGFVIWDLITFVRIIDKALNGEHVSVSDWVQLGLATFGVFGAAPAAVGVCKTMMNKLLGITIGPALRTLEGAKLAVGRLVKLKQLDEAEEFGDLLQVGAFNARDGFPTIYYYVRGEVETAHTLIYELAHYWHWWRRGKPTAEAWDEFKAISDGFDAPGGLFDKIAQLVLDLCK